MPTNYRCSVSRIWEVRTATPTATPTNTIEPGVSYKLEYRAGADTRIALSETINPNIIFQNNGGHSIDLSRVVVRYYYSADRYDGDENIQIDYAREKPGRDDITDKVNVDIIELPGNCQDRILEISFASDAGEIKKNGKIEIGLRVTRTDGNKYDQSNDYSFGDQNGWKWWEKITVYVGGYLIWGIEPPVCTLTPAPTPQLTVTPTTTPTEVPTVTPTMIPTQELIAEPMSAKNTYNYPNPCQGETTIRFSLDEPKKVSIVLYDIKGKLIWHKDLSESDTRTGVNYIVWNAVNDLGREVANGVYILKVITADKVITKKVAIIH